MKRTSSLRDPKRSSQGDESQIQEVERLRLEMNERIRRTQYPQPNSMISSSTLPSSTLSSAKPTVGGSKDSCRPLPLDSSDDRSPALDAAASKVPLRSAAQTASTESTATVKGSTVAPTPKDMALRTPSYPFPPMVTPDLDLGAQGRTFMGLSPTVEPVGRARPPSKLSRGIKDTIASDPSTPASTMTFAPAGATHPPEDPNYPTPDTYTATLMLNSEPGLEAWWNNAVEVMQEQYKAERVTLSVPGDPTDVENVPWAQKATFNIMEDEIYTYGFAEECRPAENVPNDPMAKPRTPKNSRPKLTARHSHIGVFPKTGDSMTDSTSKSSFRRPAGPHRMASYLQPSGQEKEPQLRSLDHGKPEFRLDLNKKPQNKYTQEFIPLDWSEASLRDPRAKIFAMPRGLEYEVEPLVDRMTVVKVFGKDKPVVLTREYVGFAEVDTGEGLQTQKNNVDDQGAKQGKPLSLKRTVLSSQNEPRALEQVLRARKYEEYEQVPQSPWSQSPAPSPAIREDPEHNPFFAPPGIDEEAFMASPPPHDYSQTDIVPAIGLDQASTVIHIPLFRPNIPKLSKQGFLHIGGGNTGGEESLSSSQNDSGSAASPRRRKNPAVAILSILTPVIPYPSNLRYSLTYLLPHLATSYVSAIQYSKLEAQALSGPVKRHQHAIGGVFASDDQEIETLAHLSGNLFSPPVDFPGSTTTGSITSPSDYSGISKGSPPPSPGGLTWEISSVGPASERRTPGLVGGNDPVDSYFSAKTQSPATSRPRSRSYLKDGSAPSSPKDPRMAIRGAAHRLRDQDASTSTLNTRDRLPDVVLENEDIDIKHARTTEDTPTPKRASFSSQDLKIGQTNISALKAKHELNIPRSQQDSATPARKEGHRKAASQPFQQPRKPHTLLHSHGVSLTASIPTQQAASAPLPVMSENKQPTPEQVLAKVPSGFPAPSERLARQMLDFLPMQIFLASPETGNLIWVNAKYIAYRCLTTSQIFANPWNSVHPSQRKAFEKDWYYALQHKDQFSTQVRLKRFDNEDDYRWFHVRANAMLNLQGELVHWIGTLMDIHQQHEAEAEARRERNTAASESKYRAIANAGPQIMFAANADKGIIFANSRWQAYSGQTFQDAVNFGFAEHVHPDDLKKCTFLGIRGLLTLSSGVQTATPTPALSRAQSSTRSSDSSTHTDATMHPPEHPLLECTDSNTRKESVPPLSELVRHGIVQEDTDDQGEVTYSTEIRLRSAKGEYRWHLVHLKHVDPIDFGNGEASWIGSCMDVNNSKVLEQRLNETVQSKARFLSTMSHELRTPLHGMLGLLPFLLESNLNNEQRSMMENLSSSAVTLKHLIDNYMDLQKMEAGAMKIAYNWFHVRSLLEQVNSLSSAQAIEKRLELNYLVDDDVPSEVKGDKVRVNQVLTNLVGNAIKFTSKGEIYVRCSVAAAQGSEIILMFEVVDTGKGFSKEQAALLFKTFVQLEGSDSGKQRGSGLGLVISKQLAELHGGDLVATGEPGQGSTFRFTAKFRLPSDGDQPPPDLSAAATAEEASLSGNIRQRMRVNMQNPAALSKVLRQFPSSPLHRIDMPPDSPALASSASSDPSIRSVQTHVSERSSASSVLKDDDAMKLNFPSGSSSPLAVITGRDHLPSPKAVMSPRSISQPTSLVAEKPQVTSEALHPQMYSILIVCPIPNTRLATEQHIKSILPPSIPHQLTANGDIDECEKMVLGEDPVLFTHVVLNLQELDVIVKLIQKILQSTTQRPTTLIIITDHMQKKELIKRTPQYDYAQLGADQRLHFVFRPLTPHKFAFIFDPAKEQDLSTDRNRNTAQKANDVIKNAFKTVMEAVKDRNLKILLVEDNATNLMVIRKYLDRVKLATETAGDGKQCTDMVFSHPSGYYSLIVCDIQMPVKDGYQTCREIRDWENENKFSQIPIIALSANVATEGLDQAAEAGFHDYLTKPVNFSDLGDKIINLLDPSTPNVLLRDREITADDMKV